LALLNSTKYRERFFDEIKNDFPSIPALTNRKLVSLLSKFGERLARAQLLQATLPRHKFAFVGSSTEMICSPYLDQSDLCVSYTGRFEKVSRDVFEFHVPGYQVCRNWASAGNKSGIQRKGAPLNSTVIEAYRSVLFGIEETIAIRAEIDHAVTKELQW